MKVACSKAEGTLSWFLKTEPAGAVIAPQVENSGCKFPMAASAAVLRLRYSQLDNGMPEHLKFGTHAVFRNGLSRAAAARRGDAVVGVGVGDG
jgi:hypothetical protein